MGACFLVLLPVFLRSQIVGQNQDIVPTVPHSSSTPWSDRSTKGNGSVLSLEIDRKHVKPKFWVGFGVRKQNCMQPCSFMFLNSKDDNSRAIQGSELLKQGDISNYKGL